MLKSRTNLTNISFIVVRIFFVWVSNRWYECGIIMSKNNLFILILIRLKEVII